MRNLSIVLVTTSLAANAAEPPLASLIDELNGLIQQRLVQPLPDALGMSRIMMRPSFGVHFSPMISGQRDFAPENDKERRVVATLEERHAQVGLYLFGEAILQEDPAKPHFRALKGPGSITVYTPRPRWYPGTVASATWLPEEADGLPDWNQIYPIARRAMSSFKDGGKGHEVKWQSWTIAARPAIAAIANCVSCHNHPTVHRGQAGRPGVKLGEAIGGVLYVYRPKRVS